MNYSILMLKPKRFIIWALAFLFLFASTAKAGYLEELTNSQARKPLLRIAYVAETWGELYPCPG